MSSSVFVFVFVERLLFQVADLMVEEKALNRIFLESISGACQSARFLTINTPASIIVSNYLKYLV